MATRVTRKEILTTCTVRERTPLHHAAWAGNLAIVCFLVELETTEVDCTDNNGLTPLMLVGGLPEGSNLLV
jgi:hypothetical protein